METEYLDVTEVRRWCLTDHQFCSDAPRPGETSVIFSTSSPGHVQLVLLQPVEISDHGVGGLRHSPMREGRGATDAEWFFLKGPGEADRRSRHLRWKQYRMGTWITRNGPPPTQGPRRSSSRRQHSASIPLSNAPGQRNGRLRPHVARQLSADLPLLSRCRRQWHLGSQEHS